MIRPEAGRGVGKGRSPGEHFGFGFKHTEEEGAERNTGELGLEGSNPVHLWYIL